MNRQVRVQRRRRAGWWPAVVVLTGVMLLPVPSLEARPRESEDPVYARAVWPGFRFDLTFTHSMFEIPVRERFSVDWRGRLLLREIHSTEERIIGYYQIEGAQTVVNPGDVRIAGLRLPHVRLLLRATPVGRRTYADPGCTFPLSDAAGEWGSLELSVRYRSLALQLLHWGERGCPRSQKTP